MKFYDILQCSPDVLKNMIKNTSDQKEIKRLRMGIVVRSLLLVVFSIVFISVMTAIFKNSNSAMAVSIFCILLAVRFVDYGYRVQDAIVNMAIVFALLWLVPVITYPLNGILKFVIDALALFVILLMTCDDPKMGNGGLYAFAFIFLSGNPVSGADLIDRGWMTLTGFVLCALVYAHNHWTSNRNITFWEKLKQFSFYSYKNQWQLRLAIGVALLLALFSSAHLERFMWAGFACGSLLSDSDVEGNIEEKFAQRLLGVLIGCAVFYMVYKIWPSKLAFLIGPIGGLCLGMCTEYRHKTALNCFGALMLAASMYGLQAAIGLRIFDTLLGLGFAMIFFYLYDRFILHRFLPHHSVHGKQIDR